MIFMGLRLSSTPSFTSHPWAPLRSFVLMVSPLLSTHSSSKLLKQTSLLWSLNSHSSWDMCFSLEQSCLHTYSKDSSIQQSWTQPSPSTLMVQLVIILFDSINTSGRSTGLSVSTYPASTIQAFFETSTNSRNFLN